MFWKRKADPIPEVTNESYARWLRAQRPPWLWFLQRSEIEQEALAILGDEQVEAEALAIGFAVQDPRAAQDAYAAMDGDVDAEVNLATKFAQDIANRITQKAQAAQAPVTPSKPLGPPGGGSMAGLSKRRDAAAQERATIEKRPARLFGVEPDTVVAP